MPKSKKEDVVEEPQTGAADPEESEESDLEGEDDDLDDDDDEILDVPASAAGKASAQRLLDLLVEKGGLQLRKKQVGPKLVEAVAKILEAPGSTSGRASKLSETIVDSDDVDELFVDDDTLVEILKRW